MIQRSKRYSLFLSMRLKNIKTVYILNIYCLVYLIFKVISRYNVSFFGNLNWAPFKPNQAILPITIMIKILHVELVWKILLKLIKKFTITATHSNTHARAQTNIYFYIFSNELYSSRSIYK